MNASRATTPQVTNLSPAGADKAGFRTKTVSTRLTPRELTEIELAAEREGNPTSVWASPFRDEFIAASLKRVGCG